MIAQAGLLSYRMGYTTPLEDTVCTQRYILQCIMHGPLLILTL